MSYRPYEPQQEMLLPASLQDWLPKGHLAYFINDSWNTLRQALATQHRVTVSLQRRDARCVHVRKATRPKPRHQTLGTLLKLDPNPGHTHRVLL